MLTKEAMEHLTDLQKRTHFTVECIKIKEEHPHQAEFLELAEHTNELAFLTKSLQLEVLQLQNELSNLRSGQRG